MSSSKHTYTVVVVGKNRNGEFGCGDDEYMPVITDLTARYPDISIESIFSGHTYSIYTDKDLQNCYAAGSNLYGQCCVGSNDTVYTLEKIKFFEVNKIGIKSICTSVTGNRTFFITMDNTVYGVGENNIGELGAGDPEWSATNMNIPALIRTLHDAVDIQSGNKWSIALCSTKTDIVIIIIESWLRLLVINNVPNDVINVIICFYKLKDVYSTNNFGNGERKISTDSFDRITAFDDKKIIQIGMGYMHSLFLESNGNIWSCGSGTSGELGLGKEITGLGKPAVIEYFVNNNIVINMLECGGYHSLVIDSNNKVYSWGYNTDGQLGDGTVESIYIPTLIIHLSYYTIDCICCGFWHSYCKTIDDKHYLFGNNAENQCLKYNNHEKPKRVLLPNCINEIIHNKYHKKIKSVLLGFDSTKIILL